jgi:hypothetical protein
MNQEHGRHQSMLIINNKNLWKYYS